MLYMNTKQMNSRSIYALYILDICITNYIIVYYYIILHYHIHTLALQYSSHNYDYIYCAKQ